MDVGDNTRTPAKIAVSWIAFCYAGFWLIFLLVYTPAFNPLDLRNGPFSFKVGTSIGTVVAVCCLHHLAHRWWHIVALFVTTILVLAQVSIWIQH